MTMIHIVEQDSSSADEISKKFQRIGMTAKIYSDSTEIFREIPSDGPVLIRHDFSARSVEAMCAELDAAGIGLDVIAYAHNPSVDAVVSAMKAGASDYISAPLTLKKLKKVAKHADAIGNANTPRQDRASARARLNQLTERERDVVRLLTKGYRNREIGEVLGISHRTVDVHRTNLMRRLGTTRLAELVELRIKAGDI
ncbi:LuxR C-terminal-related transcriptional regulator [Novosphingobium sp. SL115]|uniref:response regulator transcription factor n=1 Tax=Novosphingobium sp. SL115 TaxID=2995150 RepID=UPI002276EF89|nr:LuxR C-terminal-related transcriptional regulator [Novosphingobium sp. SL115]MCY1669811.1 LuxR C-terminal-related transcriptional regulator [Novosphingobium sp. SL115]